MAALLLLPSLFTGVDCLRSVSQRRNGRPIAIGRREPRKRETVAFASGNGSAGKRVVDDMEQYLEDLSLEYESVWDTKPAWCQPWSIVATGMLTIGASWPVFHSIPVTSFVTLVIAAWWFVFLYSYPQAYTQMIAERRKKVEDGDEDTFGNPQ